MSVVPAFARGGMVDLAVVRLADEGVPVKALVRVFNRPFGEVEAALKQALDDGMLLALPAADWPAGTGRGDRMPTVAPERGDVPMWLVLGARTAFGMTMSEAQILAALVWKGRCSRAWLHARITPEAAPKILDSFLCNARRKLKSYQIAIATEWGWGYSMTQEMRALARARIEVTLPREMAELGEQCAEEGYGELRADAAEERVA